MTDKALQSGIAPVYDHVDSDKIPLHSEILPGLWLGGTDDYDTLQDGVTYHDMLYKHRDITKDDYDVVITLYAHARPVDWEVEELRYGFYDAELKHVDFAKLGRAVDYAHAAWKHGKRVLIRCQAGLNRSGLTMALLLVKEGYAPVDAITLMRNKRTGFVLCNRSFEGYILDLETNDKE